MNLYFRRGNDLTSRYSTVAEALRDLPDETVIDSEPVALDEQARAVSLHFCASVHPRSGPRDRMRRVDNDFATAGNAAGAFGQRGGTRRLRS